MAIGAVIWDFGGVLTTSPFDSFRHYEQANGLPEGFLRRLNSTNPDTNAWARLERSEVSIDEFADLVEAEAEALGYRIDARAALAALTSGGIRPEMVEAVRRCKQRLRTALLTNNFVGASAGTPVPGTERPSPSATAEPTAATGDLLDLFDVVVESSKERVRKPDPAIYELVCERLRVRPDEAVFLDDLGVNLKPARQLGMTTIKVVDPEAALMELESAVGFGVR
jgi:putative hydrolase of the HAD superfamily